jgi:transcriptional/translational regulatory protein YebC/TACO1
MAGHSKWSNIKHKKNTNDIKKSKIFSKLANNIKKSIINEKNLKNAVGKAINKNMSKCVIKNIIKKSNISLNKSLYYASILENKYVFIIECMCENKNKVVNDLRNIFKIYSINFISMKYISRFFINTYKINMIEYYSEQLILTFLKKNKIKFNKSETILHFKDIDLFNYINYQLKYSYKNKKHFISKSKNKITDTIKKIIDNLKNIQYIKNIFINV